MDVSSCKLMEVTMSKPMKEFEDEQMKRKKYEVDSLMFLPDDILLDILKRLPDIFLRYKAKYVCRRWFHIITNKILLDHVSFSFILHKSTGFYPVRHVDITEKQHRLKVKQQNLGTHPCGVIKSWYNEFLLIMNSTGRGSNLYVLNLITNQRLFLPECETFRRQFMIKRCELALSFDRFKGVYKVVQLFMGPPIQCYILILERDMVFPVSSKWKKIQVPSYMDHGFDPVSVQVQVQGRKSGCRCNKSMFSYDLKDGVLKGLNICLESGDRYVVHSSVPSFMESGR
ncbi:hypothetical protein L1887_09083 [Cichorium endivia]|nr:hypothetical protein L1887_09083 [Cichorium endivia]